MIRGSKGGGFTNFLLALVAIGVIAYMVTMSINSFNTGYSTSYSTSQLSGFNNTQTLANLSDSLGDQFSGQNTSSTEGGSLGQSFNQVYTIGVVSTRILATVTPAIFNNLVFSAGNVLGIDPVIIGALALVMVLVVIGYFWYILSGREF